VKQSTDSNHLLTFWDIQARFELRSWGGLYRKVASYTWADATHLQKNGFV